jgi:hypothetical protein
MKAKQKLGVLLAVILSLAVSVPVYAQYSSPSYRVDEAQFGTGGNVDLNSNSFSAQASAGSLGVGNVSSANYDAEAGFLTENEPFLEMVVTDATVDLGLLDPNTTSSGAARAGTCNCSFTVRTYLSSNYIVATMSPPPTSEGGAVLTAKTTQAAPSGSQSVEEFGMNLVANTVPSTMGANPANVPDNTFADGGAATGYETTNQYKYNQGDTIARAVITAGNQAVGQTNYTISYIAKSKPTTAAGLYTMNHDIVVVATY